MPLLNGKMNKNYNINFFHLVIFSDLCLITCHLIQSEHHFIPFYTAVVNLVFDCFLLHLNSCLLFKCLFHFLFRMNRRKNWEKKQTRFINLMSQLCTSLNAYVQLKWRYLLPTRARFLSFTYTSINCSRSADLFSLLLLADVGAL